jgi:hypothetical protein
MGGTLNMKQSKLASALQPFARDHGIGLLCAQRLRQATRGTKEERMSVAEDADAFALKEIICALEDEKRVLSPVVARIGLGQAFHYHHSNIGALAKKLHGLDRFVDPGLGLVSRIADALDEYVRWEEGVLFPEIESLLNEQDLLALANITAMIEGSRYRSTQDLHASVGADKPPELHASVGADKPPDLPVVSSR